MSYALTVTVTDSITGQIVSDGRVNLCSDEAGATVLFSEYTSTAGVASFSLDNGTYYLDLRKVGYRFTNTTEVTIDGAAAEEDIEGTPIYVSDEETTGICNGAVALLGSGLDGEEYLASFESDTSDLAGWCRRLFDQARKRALLKFRWPEAIKLLAATDAGGDVDDAVHPGFAYAYTVPVGSGSLALRGIVNADNQPLKYRRAGLLIHTDYATSEFWWDFVENIVTGFSVGLNRCIQFELAIDLTGPVLKGEAADKKCALLIKRYRDLSLPDARGQAGAEVYDQVNAERDTPWSEIT